MTVYSYLDERSYLSKISVLSKQERKNLQDSEIARLDKKYTVAINQEHVPNCLLHDGRLEELYLGKLQYIASIADYLEIKVLRVPKGPSLLPNAPTGFDP